MRSSVLRTLLLLALILGAGVETRAQDQKPGRFTAEITIPVRLDHLIFVPRNPSVPAVDGKLPLIVFLHGAGERGNDLEQVKVHGPPKIVESDPGFPFIVLSPQCERGTRWRADALLQLIDATIEEYPVDPDRVYLTGLSMGGYGSWALAAKAPHRFAAVAPICGGGDPATAPRLAGVPIWAFHGAKDNVVPIDSTRRIVDALRDAGSDVKFTVYPDAGHDSWTETYANPELYAWFLGHRRPATSRELPTARPEDVGLSSERLQGIDPAVQRFIDDNQIAGAVTVVARRGRVAYAKAQGKMDLESGTDMRLDTIFRIYSMSKPVTSVAVLMLVEEGKIGLDDPVSLHIPDLRNLSVYVSGPASAPKLEPARREMTVRDLLRHTAGLTYGLFGNTAIDQLYRQANVLDPKNDLRATIRKLAEIPLQYQPGTAWNYSVAVDVQGRLVEVVSGQSFDRFLEERIFGPLDMKDTGFHVPADQLHRLATNYSPGPGQALLATDIPSTSTYRTPPTLLSGGGGLVSTARDYLRFCQMLLNGGELHGVRILKPETVAAMTTNQLPVDAGWVRFGPAIFHGVGFGLGVSIRVEPADAAPTDRPGQYGWAGAASTHFWVCPKEELIVVTLSQYMPFSTRLETLQPIIHGALLEDARSAVPRKREPQPVR